ncbi:MAG: hypothetical protein NDJ89_03620 [Oligoflexia bacterium]|nr:hypothetical protein [Oligoflexia bacterium]
MPLKVGDQVIGRFGHDSELDTVQAVYNHFPGASYALVRTKSGERYIGPAIFLIARKPGLAITATAPDSAAVSPEALTRSALPRPVSTSCNCVYFDTRRESLEVTTLYSDGNRKTRRLDTYYNDQMANWSNSSCSEMLRKTSECK